MGSTTSAKSVGEPSQSKLQEALRAHLEASLLPGDTPPDLAALGEAAQYLLAAAHTRKPGESLVQIESASGARRRLRIAIINDDMPFLVDSIASTIAAQGIAIDRLLHPVARVVRDPAGAITAMAKPGAKLAEGLRESLIYVETPRVDARQRRDLLEALQATLADVHAAVSDWPAMQAAMSADAALAATFDDEAAALLGWLGGGMLTQLGHLTRYRDAREEAVLGICRGSARELLAEAGYPGGEGFPEVEIWYRDQGGYNGAITAPMLQYLQAEYEEHLGIEMGIRVMPIQDWMQALTEETNNLFLSPYEYDYIDPSNFFGIFYGGGRHDHRVPEYDELVAAAGSAADWEERLDYYAQAEQILLYDNVSVIPLVHPIQTFVFAEGVSGDATIPTDQGLSASSRLTPYFYTHLTVEE